MRSFTVLLLFLTLSCSKDEKPNTFKFEGPVEEKPASSPRKSEKYFDRWMLAQEQLVDKWVRAEEKIQGFSLTLYAGDKISRVREIEDIIAEVNPKWQLFTWFEEPIFKVQLGFFVGKNKPGQEHSMGMGPAKILKTWLLSELKKYPKAKGIPCSIVPKDISFYQYDSYSAPVSRDIFSYKLNGTFP